MDASSEGVWFSLSCRSERAVFLVNGAEQWPFSRLFPLPQPSCYYYQGDKGGDDGGSDGGMLGYPFLFFA